MTHPISKLPRGLLKPRYILGVLVLGAALLTAFELNTAYVRDMVHESIYGTKPHRIPCNRWPTPDEVDRVLEQHAEVVRRIESIKPEGIDVFVRAGRCRGRVEIGIYYQTWRHRDEIKQIIGDEKRFFGVPYTLFNW